MALIEMINLWQTIFTAVGVVAAFIAAVLAYRIGKRQNEINELALKISDFSELFFMPQTLLIRDEKGIEKIGSYNILVKNISSYPVYLNSYILNDEKTVVGVSPLPHDPDSWYTIPIPKNVQDTNKFSLEVEFETYLGEAYKTNATGKFNGSWGVNSTKKVKL